MRKPAAIPALSVAAVFVFAAALAAQAQKPAPSPSEEVSAHWNDVGRKLIAMAEDWPEDKYDFNPVPEVRSFRALLLHVAAANYFFTNAVAGRKVGEETDDPPADLYKTKASVVAYLKKSFADGAAVIKEKGDAALSQMQKHPFASGVVSQRTIWFEGAEHAGEHYGNLVVYYRLNKMVPPESRPRQ